MTENRKDCPMRHESGNCTVAGGFCTAVNDPVCEALHNAFDCGYRSSIRVHQETVTNRNGLKAVEIDQVKPLTQDELRRMDGEPVWLNIADGVWALVDTDDSVVWLDRGGSIDIIKIVGKAYRQKPEEGTV